MAKENSAHLSALEQIRDSWFLHGDERALVQLLGTLRSVLVAPASLIAALGSGEVDETREDVLIRLLDRKHGALANAESPLGLALVAFRRALLDRLRSRVRVEAGARLVAVAGPIDETSASPFAAVALAEQAQRAAAALSALTVEQRAAVVLRICPERLPVADRAVLRGGTPGEPLPVGELSVESASALLFGASPTETKAEREQRVNRFHHLLARALAALRRHLVAEETGAE